MTHLSLYFHIVWTTKQRQPWLIPPKREAVYRCALKMIRGMGYEVLAINGMPDHVHLLLQSGAQIDLAVLMKKIKGVTSAMVNDMTDHGEYFRWQEGYYAATVTPSHVPGVRAYVEQQEEHHRQGTTHPAWEETDKNDEESGH